MLNKESALIIKSAIFVGVIMFDVIFFDVSHTPHSYDLLNFLCFFDNDKTANKVFIKIIYEHLILLVMILKIFCSIYLLYDN